MDYNVYYLCGTCDDKHAYNRHPGYPDVMSEACSHSFQVYIEDTILQSYVASEEDELAGEEVFEFLTQEVCKVRDVPKVEFITKCHICKEHVFPDFSNRTDDGLFQLPEWIQADSKYTLMPPNIDMQFRTYPVHKNLPNVCTGDEAYPFTKISFEVRHQECARKVYPTHISHMKQHISDASSGLVNNNTVPSNRRVNRKLGLNPRTKFKRRGKK